ncbi:hypothetical protein EDB14_2147 [Vibrio crassostreae]|uniref:hypothetical protein n=1 Tax=Vibrio crassostreae TaxID=246167 RepID=UPI000F4E6ED8|nr:hypothetical protein [Vibrio crassostreae]RPF11048.1 hypothetical protein EDB14_2147 [Vibrio crassostreae]
MAFVIDSEEWDFNGLNCDDVVVKLEQLLAQADNASLRNEDIFVGNDLQSKSVCGTMDLWTFLNHSSMSGINSELISELSAFLNSAVFYEDDDACWPRGFPDVIVHDSSGKQLDLDLTFIHLKLIEKEPFACLTLDQTQFNETTSVKGAVAIQYIFDEVSHKKFWRETAQSLLRDTAATLESLAPHAYPSLYFQSDVWSGIDSFDGGYKRVSVVLRKYLSILDDYGSWVFIEPPPALHPSDTVAPEVGKMPTNADIENRFEGLGLDIVPEKPNVFKKKKCRRAREILFEWKDEKNNKYSEVLYCGWHGRFERHINRLHLFPPIPASKNKLIIGIFHKHLPLP